MPHVTKDLFKTGAKIELQGFASRSLILFIAFGIVLLVAIGIAIYFDLQYQNTRDQLTRTTQVNEQAALVNEVSKLIDLPTGEQPSIATVSDITKLKGQPFFAQAKDGDKVLIYTKAKKAILYDPFANKIVEVGPVSLTQPKPTDSEVAGIHAGPTLAPVSVALYNGTSIVGFAASVSSKLQKEMPNVMVTSKTDAQKSTYTSTIVVDLTGKNSHAVTILAKDLKGKVGSLPQDESKPANADILVILGK